MRQYFLIILVVFSCKSEKKESNTLDNQIQNSEKKEESFEKSLLDLRDVEQNFTKEYRVKSFGVKKENDSTYYYVLRLDNNTLQQTVEMYSVGSKAYNNESVDNKLLRSYSPDIKTIEGNNYLVLKIAPTNWKYMDSIDFYIYARKDWKASGRLGAIKVRDILYED